MLTIQEIYRIAIEMGIASDPRGQSALEKQLQQRQEKYAGLSRLEQRHFDQDSLHNPFADTRLLFGDPASPVRKVFVGIDVGVGELLLVDRLNQNGAGIELVLAHHPEGLALTTLHEMLGMQADMFACCGVPLNVGENILPEEMTRTERGIIVLNYNRVVDAARLLNLPLMCVHTPTDNLVQRHTERLLEQRQPETLADVIALLEEMPEYVLAGQSGAGPRILYGQPGNRLGKALVDMTGGTDAGKAIYSHLGQAGVSTIVSMHMTEPVYDTLREQHINIILAGHMSSDSVGVNLLIDRLESLGLETIAGAGFTRVPRLAPR